ncbi:trigger factor [Sulfurimonas sp. NWX367]|uniref:trigger factor n=1 Tax=Sulfurimonas sp. NWX367 TaxID=2925413 RepID=UPI003204B9BC
MEVSVKKIDDINFILSGTIENNIIENKVAEFKEKLTQGTDNDTSKSENIEQEAAGEVFKEFINTGIKKANIDIDTILGQPLLKKYEQQENNVYFEVALSTSPQINTDIDYNDIIPDFTKPKADPAAVEAKLQEFAQQQAPFTKIDKPRAVKAGDVAVIDFAGSIDGKPFEGGSAEKFNLKIGSQSFIPGFEEQIIGMEYGEERTITVTFPADYQAEDLAGKETKFAVKLHEIQQQEAQTPDDAFAQKILSDPSATLDTLKEKFADQIISEELSQLYMQELKPKIINALIEKFDFTLPENIVEQEIDAKVREKTKNYTEEEHKQFLEDKEKFLQLRESVREDAKRVVKTALIVEALAKKEGIDVHIQEVHAALGYQAMMTGQDAQELVKYYEENNLMTSAKMGLTEDKLFGKLLGFHNQ